MTTDPYSAMIARFVENPGSVTPAEMAAVCEAAGIDAEQLAADLTAAVDEAGERERAAIALAASAFAPDPAEQWGRDWTPEADNDE